MSLLPITLGVRRGAGAQESGGRPARKGTRKQLRKQTLERDGFTCRYCGFTSGQFQKVIPKDWEADAEMVTACLFCEQCLSLENVTPMNSGVLVWLPELGQAALNHVMRAVYASRAFGAAIPDSIHACAQRAYDVLLHARGDAKRRIGTDDPAVLASALFEGMSDRNYQARGAKLQGLRLMPLDRRMVWQNGGETDVFPQIIEYYVSESGPFGKLSPEKWLSLKSFLKAANA